MAHVFADPVTDSGASVVVAPGVGGVLPPNTSLMPVGGQTSIGAESVPYSLVMQTDGNLVLYRTDQTPAKPTWATGTNGQAVVRATMQADGNFVLYTAQRPVWATGTDGHPGAQLELGEDGNLIIFDTNRTALWSSRSVWMPPTRSAPVLIHRVPNVVDTLIVGTDAAIWYQQTVGSAAGAWESLGGTFVSDLSAVSLGPDHLAMFAIDGDGVVTYNSFSDGHTWQGWQTLGGLAAVDAPSACSSAPGRIDLFVHGGDDALWQRTFAGGAWAAS